MRTALKVFRVKHKLTQGEFAEKVGYSRSQYALIEQGNRQGTQAFWSSVQAAFNVSDADMWSLTKIDEE